MKLSTLDSLYQRQLRIWIYRNSPTSTLKGGTRLKKFVKDESGQGLAEYALILALVALVVIAALTTLGTKTKEKMQGVATELGT
jgi:pilus assembly protein Flp/PilA